MVHESFKEKLKQESNEFKALMNIMNGIDESCTYGRKLLNLLNQIIDYYIIISPDKEEQSVKMPIVYFPLCEPWTQNLCENFVALKMALLFGNKTVQNIKRDFSKKNFLELPANVTGKYVLPYQKQFHLRKKIANNFDESLNYYPAGENEKCLIFSRYLSEQYKKTVKSRTYYHFVKDLLSAKMMENPDTHDYLYSKESLILIDNDADSLYDSISENDGNQKIPYIFLFPQKEMDGRNVDLCLRLDRNAINEYNQDFDTGVKNVFFFIFSKKPYRLQRIYENKHNFVECIQRERTSNTRDFISFTKEEMDYIFDRTKNDCIEYELQIGADREFKEEFEIILQELPHEVKLRNELAVAFTNKLLNHIKDEISEFDSELNEDYLTCFLQLIKLNYKENLKDFLQKWIDGQSLAVILDFRIDDLFKSGIKSFLCSECSAKEVSFYTFRDLKPHKISEKYCNDIPFQKILVLSMLNHCTGKNWAIYPNSFDQICTNKNQEVLKIINRISFDPRYSWYRYRYLEQMRLILNSNFRYHYIGNEISHPLKPDVGLEPKDDIDEQNVRTNSLGNEQIRYKITYADNQHRTLLDDDLVLCRANDENFIGTIADVERIFDQTSDLMIQPLEDFFPSLSNFIEDSTKSTTTGEGLIRKNPTYNLSEDEIESDIEMWKIILSHKVNEFGEKKVYDDIMGELLPIERIKINSFRKWLDVSDKSILPRSRRMQRRVIEEYLQIDHLYLRILRHRKSKISTNTEERNVIFKTFLSLCLLEDDSQKVYDELSNAVCDYMDISDEDDVKAYVELIKENLIDLRQVNNIKKKS